jgi:hypothetical protein
MKNNLQGIKKYEKSLMNVASEYIKKDYKKNKEELEKVFGNLLLDNNWSVDIQYNLSKNENFFEDIFFGFSEIKESYESLRDIEVYISNFPYENIKISKVRYLRHNIEAFFHEIYILRERLIQYLNIIKKNYKSTRLVLEVNQKCDCLKQKIYDSLESISSIRGEHVHAKRYSDKNIQKLIGLELTSDSSDWLEKYFQSQYEEIQKKWTNKIIDLNKELKKILDYYFEELHMIIFADSKLVYPGQL